MPASAFALCGRSVRKRHSKAQAQLFWHARCFFFVASGLERGRFAHQRSPPMSHLSGHCSCGRRIHFPKHSSYGSSWRCRTCGQSWVIARHGQPLHNARSKAPPVDSVHSADEPNWAAVIVAGLLILFLIGSCT